MATTVPEEDPGGPRVGEQRIAVAWRRGMESLEGVVAFLVDTFPLDPTWSVLDGDDDCLYTPLFGVLSGLTLWVPKKFMSPGCD